MKIGIAQLAANTKINAAKSVQSSSEPVKFSSKQETSKFGSVYKKVLDSTSTAKQQNTVSDSKQEVEKVEKVLKAQSVEELFDLLGIKNGDNQDIPTEMVLKLEDLMATLNIDAAQLFQTIKQLSGEEKKASDLWELMSLVQENAPALISQISASLQGEHKVASKDAEQLLKLLKLSELIGKQSDLTLQQEVKLIDVKEVLSQVTNQLQKVNETNSGKIALPGFQQIIQQTVTKQEDISSNEMVSQTAVTTKNESVTITLPATKPAQSEAFLKEMQAIINKAQSANVAGLTKLSIKLYPENLGSIRIELTQQNGVLTAKLLASTALGRDLLDQNAHQLKQAFIQQNIQVDRLDITQALQDANRNSKDQGFFNQSFKQQQEEHEEKQEDNEEKLSFSEFLIDEEV